MGGRVREQLVRESSAFRLRLFDPGQILKTLGMRLGSLTKEVPVDGCQSLVQRIVGLCLMLEGVADIIGNLLKARHVGDVPPGGTLDVKGQLGEDVGVGGDDGSRLGSEAEPRDDGLHGWKIENQL
jgi:hypothetical protein